MGRRRVLGLAAAGAVAALAKPAFAALTEGGVRRLAFENLHTGEKLAAIYWRDGSYVADELRAIDRVLRDFRTGEVARIDPKLMDLLYALRRSLDSTEPLHVISGYRSPRTNAALRRVSDGVASQSLHTVGKAIDIRIPGRELTALRDAALTLELGGVGFYPKSDFVHVDTGRVRRW